jgi:hypothetical protein
MHHNLILSSFQEWEDGREYELSEDASQNAFRNFKAVGVPEQEGPFWFAENLTEISLHDVSVNYLEVSSPLQAAYNSLDSGPCHMLKTPFEIIPYAHYFAVKRLGSFSEQTSTVSVATAQLYDLFRLKSHGEIIKRIPLFPRQVIRMVDS